VVPNLGEMSYEKGCTRSVFKPFKRQVVIENDTEDLCSASTRNLAFLEVIYRKLKILNFGTLYWLTIRRSSVSSALIQQSYFLWLR